MHVLSKPENSSSHSFCALQTGAEHKTKPSGIDFVEVSGDEKAMREWIGADVDLRWTQGVPGVHAVGIKTDAGTIILK